jgi:hypothetical protein
MLSDKYLWPVPELTLVHKTYKLVSFQEPVTYLHSIAKRAKVVALVDSGATENFLNLTYAKWL